MFYSGFDALFSILFPLMFLVVLGMILFTIVGNLRTWSKNNAPPRLTVPATVVAKRTNVSRHHTDNTMSHTFTTYYATFQVESGDRMELEVDGSDYGMLREDNTGKLSFQGTRYLGCILYTYDASDEENRVDVDDEDSIKKKSGRESRRSA